MAESSDMILPLLREMRAEIAGRFDEVDRRLDKMDESLVTFRHALSADSLLSKIVTGEFEERLEFLERKVKELEGQK